MTSDAPVASAVPVRPTSRAAWSFVLGAAALMFAWRAPTLARYVEQMLAASPDVTVDLTDAHLRRLAVDIGLLLAVLVSIGLLAVYQSLGRALERRVFTRSVVVGRARLGLFFLVSTSATLPASFACALLTQVSLRTSAWYYLAVVAVTICWVLAFHRHWRGLGRTRIAILFSCTVVYGLLATLI